MPRTSAAKQKYEVMAIAEMGQPLPGHDLVTPVEEDVLPALNVQLVEHAEAIRVLGRRVIGDVIEIGRRLTEAKALCKHGEWLPWLKQEFGWAERTAQNFMSVAEMAFKSAIFADLNIDVSALYLLAAPSTPEPVRQEVIERAEAGERFTHAQVQELICAARAEAASEAASEASSKAREQLDLLQAEKTAALRRLADEKAVELRRIEAEKAAEIARLYSEREATLNAEIAKAREAVDTELERLKEQYAGRISQDEAEEAVANAVRPLETKLAGLQKRLTRHEEEKKKHADSVRRALEEKTPRMAEMGRAISAMKDLSIALSAITPDNFLLAAEQLRALNGQPVRRTLGEPTEHARVIAAWIGSFLALAGNVGES